MNTSHKQMILPCFEYCDFILESGPEGTARNIQTLQNHCLRCCMGIRDPRAITIDDLHVECTMNRLITRRNNSLLGLVYKYSRKDDVLVVPARVLRSNNKVLIKLLRPKGQLYRDSPLYRGVVLWDQLLPSVQESENLDIFMSKVKNLWNEE